MNKLFSGIVAVAFIAMLATPVFADTFPVEAGPGNFPPQIYLVWSAYDICASNGEGFYGGSRPYIPTDGVQNAQFGGCIVLTDEVRFDEYAFTGEQILFTVVVRDLNGAPDIGYTHFTVDGDYEAKCNDMTFEWGWLHEGMWSDIIPAKPFVPAGFHYETDRAFECILTVEPSWYGENMINIEAMDQAGTVSDFGIAQTWFFNPAVIVDLGTNDGAPSIGFEDGFPGQTVMSTNKLIITNMAEGGVDLWAFLAADDLTDPSHSGAKCPVSNVLDVDYNMEYRCKIGTFEDEKFDYVPNKDTSQDCLCDECIGALPLLYNYDGPGTPPYSIIKNFGSAECQFRLHYPVPCIGDFTEGAFHVIVRVL